MLSFFYVLGNFLGVGRVGGIIVNKIDMVLYGGYVILVVYEWIRDYYL